MSKQIGGGGRPQGERAWSEVEPLDGERYLLSLGGRFSPGWMANLCAEIARRKFSIERARAVRNDDQTWGAALELTVPSGLEDPTKLRFEQLAEQPWRERHDPPRILRYSVDVLAERECLVITVEAHDSLGLLGGLLSQLAMLMLFPIEMQIETLRGRAYDTFCVTGMSGAPDGRVRDAVERMLRVASSDRPRG